jgi:ParB/RepB/Spo0J family partition protein
MSRDIPLAAIRPDPEQPRKHFDRVQLRELAQSMQANGLAMPILVRPAGDQFVIIAGERRFRAAQLLGWETIAADVRDADAETARWLALVENVQRADLTPSEEARAFQAHMREGLTQKTIAARIGKTQSYVAQKLRLLKLPEPLLLFLDRGALSEGHARQLLRLEGMYYGLTTRINPDGADYDQAELASRDRPAALLGYLVQLRPHAEPVWAPIPKDEETLALCADGCRSFARWLAHAPLRTPVWGLTAFWYACAAIVLNLSVTDLHDAIDGWHELFLAAVVWYTIHGRMAAPTGSAESMPYVEWWGYYADLKHALHQPPRQLGQLPPELSAEALMAMAEKGSALPTAMQPYGTHAEMGALGWESPQVATPSP